jgi:hypothetical protein
VHSASIVVYPVTGVITEVFSEGVESHYTLKEILPQIELQYLHVALLRLQMKNRQNWTYFGASICERAWALIKMYKKRRDENREKSRKGGNVQVAEPSLACETITVLAQRGIIWICHNSAWYSHMIENCPNEKLVERPYP